MSITYRNIRGLPDKAKLWCPVDALAAIGISAENRARRVIREFEHPDPDLIEQILEANPDAELPEPVERPQREYASVRAHEIREALDRLKAEKEKSSAPVSAPTSPSEGEPTDASVESTEQPSDEEFEQEQPERVDVTGRHVLPDGT